MLYNLCVFNPFAPQVQEVPTGRTKLILWGGLPCLLHIASHSKVPAVLEYCQKTVLKHRLGINDVKAMLKTLVTLEPKKLAQESSNKRSMPSLLLGEDRTEPERSSSQENKAEGKGLGKDEEGPEFSEYMLAKEIIGWRER